MWVFATTPHAGWHTCGEDFSFRVGLLPFLAKMDFLPISTYFESQATPLSKPHGYAILLTSVPSSMPQDSIAEAVESCPLSASLMVPWDYRERGWLVQDVLKDMVDKPIVTFSYMVLYLYFYFLICLYNYISI